EGVVLLEQEGRDNLLNFANTGVGEIEYEAYLAEVPTNTPANMQISTKHTHTHTQTHTHTHSFKDGQPHTYRNVISIVKMENPQDKGLLVSEWQMAKPHENMSENISLVAVSAFV